MALAAVLTDRPAMALEPDRDVAQYLHDRWEGDRGFPGGSVHTIAQSSDGYLWIGADKGLVRFDGLAFRLIQPVKPTVQQDQSILALVADAIGGLWAQLRTTELLRYEGARFRDLPKTLASLPPAVTALTSGM